VTARPDYVSALARVGLPVLAALLMAVVAGTPWAARPAAVPAAAPQQVPSAVVHPALDGPEALAAVRRLLAAGAPALALLRIERSQAPGVRWAEWETLRLTALTELGLWHRVAARAEALPASSQLPGPYLRAVWLAGAEAALRSVGPTVDRAPSARPAELASTTALARALAARVIWSPTPGADELRRARLVVIESLFAGGDVEAGHRSILRFRQDMPAPGIAASARFVASIAAHGVPADAVPLLPSLPETHPVRIAAQVQLGLVPPSIAAAQVRAAMRAAIRAEMRAEMRTPMQAAMQAETGSAATTATATAADSMRDWQALFTAARAIGDTLLVVQASERLLDADPPGDVAVIEARALWRDYLAAAPVLANREQLLDGDVFGWSDAAARLAARDPVAARTLFAFLSVKASDPAVRATAGLQLASLLREEGLGRAAVRLFLDRDMAGSAPQTADLRRLLGDTAAARRMWVPAVELRRGLAPRPGEDAAAWLMAGAELQAMAGRIDAVPGGLPWAALNRPDLLPRAHALADLLADAGEAVAAARIREAAGPVPARRP
jgi:hypothetical protein